MRGESDAIYHQLADQMQKAIERTQFERAARLQEDAAIFKWLHGKLKQLQKASCDPPSLYWVETTGGSKFPKGGIVYMLRSGGVEFAVAYRTKSNSIRETLEAWLGADKQIELKYCRPHETLGLVATWFQKNPSLKKNRLPVRTPGDAMGVLSKLTKSAS